MAISMVELLVTAGVFVLASGLMALIEAAVLSVTQVEAETMVQRGLRGARQLLQIKSRLTSAVVVMVVFTNVINILGPVLVGAIAVELFGSTVLGVITAILTFATIVFSEIIPKSLGTHYATRISRLVAPGLRVLTMVFLPIVWLFERLTGALKKGERRMGTEDQIRSLVRLGHSAGYIETDETQMVQRVFGLNDRTAGDLMTRMDHVAVIRSGSTVEDAIAVVIDAGFSRFPVISPTGSVIGLLLSRDLLSASKLGGGESTLAQLVRPPLFVDVSVRADDLLVLFRAKKSHMAFVQERGRDVGIVTLEDVLEEIVGEIHDEKDDGRATPPG
jgi:CBS domain containing-hemolysin-like protein